MSALDPSVKPSTWYQTITPLTCNKLHGERLCGQTAVAVEHDPHTGYTGVNRCARHIPTNTQIHGKD